MRKLALVVLVVLAGLELHAASTVNSTNKWAWAANSGWLNGRADVTNGIVVGEYICSGYLWSSATGWIHLGGGNPTNGIRYTNVSSNDYGVNHDGLGSLRGYAWSPTIGWINFETSGNPRIDLKTGVLRGYAWGGSLGWISFTNTQAFLQTESFYSGPDNDSDGMPDVWEVENAGSTSVYSLVTDSDGDTVTDLNEYLGGTNPEDDTDFLHITGLVASNGANSILSWSSSGTRVYRVESTDDLVEGDWQQSGVITPDAGGTTVEVLPDAAATQQFIRVRAIVPPGE